jgi:VanZ family protein
LPESPAQPDWHDSRSQAVPDERRVKRLRVLWIGFWVLLFGLTHWPKPPPLGHIPESDKVMHFIAYFTLALAGGRLWLAQRRTLTAGWIIVWWGVYAGYAAIDELLQELPFIHRSCELGDWLADIVGVSAALLITWSGRHRAAQATSE